LSKNILQIVDLPVKVFDDADLDTTIAIFNNLNDKPEIQIGEIIDKSIRLTNHTISKKEILEKDDLSIHIKLNDRDNEIINKIQSVSVKLETLFEVSQGLIPYDKYRGHDEHTIKNRIWHSEIKKDETYKEELKGQDISRYKVEWNGHLWVSYGNWLAAPRNPKFFTSPRILIMEITRGEHYRLKAAYTEKEYYNTPSVINVIHPKNNVDELKVLLTLLNSRLFTWYHNKVHPKALAQTSIPKILVTDVRNLPVIIDKKQNELLSLCNLILENYTENQTVADKFIARLKSNLNIEKITLGIKEFYNSDFKTLLNELKKQKNKLSLKQQDEWENYFNENKQLMSITENNISKINKQIDDLIYSLYGLSKDEIEIIEKD